MSGRYKFIPCFLLLVLCIIPAVAFGVPQIMSYQGTLHNKQGAPVTGDVSMTLKIYDVPTGDTGLLWHETKTVQVSNGVFNTQIGSATPLPPAIFAKDTLYLGIQVGADQEMVPGTVKFFV